MNDNCTKYFDYGKIKHYIAENRECDGPVIRHRTMGDYMIIGQAEPQHREKRKKIKEIKLVAEQLKQSLGRAATTTELAAAMNMEKEKIEALLADEMQVTSIYDKKGTSEESVEVIDTIQDENSKNPLEQLVDKDVKHELQNALKRLPERERMIMVLYYHENMTLKEIGDTINVSESRVCQLHAQAIMKLKNILTAHRADRLKQSIA